MKKIIVSGMALMLFFGNALNVSAQETHNKNLRIVTEENGDKHLVQTNHFWSNWFIMAGGGAQMFFGDHNKQMKFMDRLSPAVTAGVGKWFTPGIGVRLMYNGYEYEGVTQIEEHGTGELYDWTHSSDYTTSAPPMYKQKTKFYHLHADVLFNLNNLLSGYKENRFWTISPYVGLGYAVTDDKYKAKEVSANLGFLNTFRLCSALDLSFDVHGMLVNDRFDGELGHRPKEGGLSATVGLVYKFKKRGWDRCKNVTVYDESEQNALRERLEQSEGENRRLKDALANVKPVKEIQKDVIAAPNYVTFKINQTTLSKEARVSLGLFAEAIKSGDKSHVYVISGFADAATGNAKGNERLSKGRAEAVYDCLTKEFGVPADQLTVDYKGGVDNMFYNEPRLSRAVITRVK